MNAAQLREKLLGSWRLVSWEWRNAAGNVNSPLGDDPVGLLTYDASGTVSAQLMRPNQPRFGDDDWQRATAEEKAAAWSAYFGYFGRYTIAEGAGAVTHHIEGSWFPNLVGTEQVRICSFIGDRLSLHAETPWGSVTIVWEKVVQ
jgi:Lipocalin-like domain